MATTQSPFSETLPTFQIAWDSTSMGLLKECPRKYQLSQLLGWRAKREATPLTFGIYYHQCMEQYHKLRAGGHDYTSAFRETLRFALGCGGTYENGQFLPWQTDDPKRNRVILVQAVAWYLLHFQDDPTETIILKNGKPAVELSFRFALPFDSPTGEQPIYCGHIDRVAQFGDEQWSCDYKTTVSQITPEYFLRYSPDLQMSGYTVASQVVFQVPARGVLIDAIQLGANFARPRRGFATRTQAQLDEFVGDLRHWINIAHGYAVADYWPMNDKACSNFGGCVFREICGKDPSMRQSYLQTHFEIRKWNPLESR